MCIRDRHIARHLHGSGFNYFVTETAHPVLHGSAVEQFGYGLFTARYGNIYTARQLRQLLSRAYGEFVPADDAWPGEDGRVIDPFRPQIQPDGFASRQEYEADRSQHFAAIRRAIEELDVFVFTLGLTEAWMSKLDGAIYPLCPGVAGGTYDPDQHIFVNFSADDVIGDMSAAIAYILRRNPEARFILTVSPVPLVATFEDRSALVSTTYSKSVLRVACEELSRHERVAYFPSYEIITGNFNRGAYFAKDLRSVNETGVNHVMRLFMKHYASDAPQEEPVVISTQSSFIEQMEDAVAVVCDEEALAR